MKRVTKKDRVWKLHEHGCTPTQITQIVGGRRETVCVLLAQKRAELRKLNDAMASNG